MNETTAAAAAAPSYVCKACFDSAVITKNSLTLYPLFLRSSFKSKKSTLKIRQSQSSSIVNPEELSTYKYPMTP